MLRSWRMTKNRDASPPPSSSNVENGYVWAKDLLNFLFEKSNETEIPLNVKDLSTVYAKSIGELAARDKWESRARIIAENISKMKKVDVDSRVKMLFALGVSIEPDFLNQLKEEADVEVDRLYRITKYKKRGGKLEFEGEHSRQYRGTDENDKMALTLLKIIARNRRTPIGAKAFLKELKKVVTGGIQTNRDTYQYVKLHLFRSTDLDMYLKIKMIFVSGATVPDHYLRELRNDAVVIVDEENRITKYVSFDKCLQLEDKMKRKVREMIPWHRFRLGDDVSDDDKEEGICPTTLHYNNLSDQNIIDFLVEKTKNVTAPMILSNLYRDLEEQYKPTRALVNSKRIQRIRDNVHELKELDTTTKVKMMFALSSPVSPEFLDFLRQTAHVALDEKNRIIVYKSNDGRLKLAGDLSRLAKMRALLGVKRVVNKIKWNENVASSPSTSFFSTVSIKHVISEFQEEPKLQTTQLPNNQLTVQMEYEPVLIDVETNDVVPPPMKKKCRIIKIKEKEEKVKKVEKRKKPREQPPTTNLKDFLNFIHGIVLTLDTSSLLEVQNQIEEMINHLGGSGKKIPIETIRISLDHLLRSLEENATFHLTPNIESTSLRDFILLLKAATGYIKLPSFEGFQQQLRNSIDNLSDKDKSVPVEMVSHGLKMMLDEMDS